MRSRMMLAGLLVAAAVLARCQAQRKVPPELPEPRKRMGLLEAFARAIQAVFVVTAIFAFTLVYAPFAESTAMFWLFNASMGIILITHLYLYFKTLKERGRGN